MSVPPPRPGFVASKFVQNQFISLAKHTVLRKPILAVYSRYLKQSGANSLTPVEDRKRNGNATDEEDPDLNVDPNTRILFAVRPPSNIVGGTVGCCWNLVLGQLGSPFVALSVLWTTTNNCAHGRYIGALWGVGWGMVWGACFALLGALSGAQQLLVGAANQVAGPYYALLTSGPSRRYWSPATCEFVTPLVVPQPQVAMHRGSEEMVLDAMRRQSNRQKRSQEEKGFDSMFDKNGNLKDNAPKKKRERTYYDVLDINRTATDREIKEAYAKLAMKLHPDRNPNKNAHEEFDELTKAYRTLGNAEKRRRYDAAGISGSEDIGSKKRTAVRSFFGGDDLAALVGDVRRNNFNRRFIDETDFPLADLAIINQRMEDGCVRELLEQYLEGYPVDPKIGGTMEDQNVSATEEEFEARKRDWEQKVKKRILKYANVALAKEVMHVVGHQYLLTMQLVSPTVPAAMLPRKEEEIASNPSVSSSSTPSSSASSKTSTVAKGKTNTPDKLFEKGQPVKSSSTTSGSASAPIRLNLKGGVFSRLNMYTTSIFPRFVKANFAKASQVFKLNPSVKDPAIIMDFVWKLSVTELQQMAHKVALRVLCDAEATDSERRRRLGALIELSTIFITSGKPYSTVDKRTMEMMTDSLRDYYSKTGKPQ